MKKDYKAAAAGFAKAAAADPTWTIAAYNLASALQLAGDKPAATSALAPRLSATPVATYLHVAHDPELAPLLDQPALAAVRATKAGTAQLTSTGELKGRVAYAKERGLLAVTRTEASWGACGVHTTELQLIDVKTGAAVASEATIEWAETDDACDEQFRTSITKRARATIAARAKRLSRALADLGFVPVTFEAGRSGRSESGAQTYTFATAKLGIAAASGTARLLTRTTELGQTSVLDHLSDAIVVGEPHVAVIWSGRPGREGCEGTDPTQVSVISFTKP